MLHKCFICNEEFKLKSIARHVKGCHNIEPWRFYIKMFKNNKKPLCSCGCGEETKFVSYIEGYRKYKRGHKSRIENPHIYRTQNSFDKISKTRIKMHKNGELFAWNKGLTKEDDDRVAKYGLNGSETISSNSEEIKRRSERMKENRLNGIVPTLYGKDHSQWKGGSSSVSARCHGNRRLYQEWKYPKLKAVNFICQRCGSNERLEVHHNKEKMSEIIHTMTEKLNPDKKDDFGLQTKVMEAVIEYHIDNDVSGEVICHECHKEEHPSYNYMI